MRITPRDITLLQDLALSHVLSRNQILALQYFGSVSRLNSRLRELCRTGFVRRLETVLYTQSLYVATKRSAEVMNGQMARLLEGRAPTPRFLQHALATTGIRIAMCHRTSGTWRFEQQLWRKLPGAGVEVRPDGLITARTPIFIETDLAHVNPKKFKEKLHSYAALAKSGLCRDLYGFDTFRLLTVTTGSLRARHLRRLVPPDSGFECLVQTFEEVGATPIPSWS